MIESRIRDINSTMIDMLKISTGELQSEIDVNTSMIDMLKVSTGELTIRNRHLPIGDRRKHLNDCTC